MRARFPEDTVLIARLYFANEAFRSLCEDFCLALATLSAFEKRTDGSKQFEIAEYRGLLRELEAEIRFALKPARSDH
jgi:hypothetical protein